MAGDKRTSSGEQAAPPARRKRTPATIDLTATEIASEPSRAADPEPETKPDDMPPAEPQAPSQPEPAAEASPEAAPEPPPEVTLEPPPVTPPAPDGAPPPARSNPWLLVASGLGGAAIVAVVFLGLWATGRIPERDAETSVLAARLLSLEARLRDLASRPAPMPPAPTPAPAAPQPPSDLAARLARLEAAVNAPRPPAGDPALAARMATVEQSVASVAAEVARLKADTSRAASQGVDRRDIEALGQRLAALEQTAKTLQDEAAKQRAAPPPDRPLRLALAAEALNAAVFALEPYQVELAAAKSLGGDAKALAPLDAFAATGLPPAAALSAELHGLIPAMARAAAPALPPAAGGFLDKLQASAERLVRIRPVGEAPGSDAGAVLGRIGAAAARGDLATTIGELAKLPAPVRAPAEGWIAKVQARQAALAASRRFAVAALAGLAKPTE